MKMKLCPLSRSSNPDVAQGYGPSIQEAEMIAYAATNNYELLPARHIVEPATIDLEDRQLFQNAIAEVVLLRDRGQCDGVILSRCDRLSRTMEGAIQVALDLKRANLTIVLCRENQVLKPDSTPLDLLIFIMQAFGVDTQTRVFLTNTREGQRKAAESGKLPSGVGAKGLCGYDLIGPRGEKKFQPNGDIWLVDEVLKLGIKGESLNEITRKFQSKGIKITRDTVRKILKHARTYAGFYKWGGLEIPNLVPARINIEQAEVIETNMRHNKEQSYGWGKRKWITGRVRCGECGASYALELGKKRCHCRRANPLETLSPCSAPKVAYRKLSNSIWKLLIINLADPVVLNAEISKTRSEWEERRTSIESRLIELKNQLDRLKKQKQRLSIQHQYGIVDDLDLIKRSKGIDAIIKQMESETLEIDSFIEQPPPREIDVDEWRSSWLPFADIDAVDEYRAKLAELIDLRVVIQSVNKLGVFRLQLSAKVPLALSEATISEPTQYNVSGGDILKRFSPDRISHQERKVRGEALANEMEKAVDMVCSSPRKRSTLSL
jgi:DNA invertase Pin-like site-specific DNA recombinase